MERRRRRSARGAGDGAVTTEGPFRPPPSLAIARQRRRELASHAGLAVWRRRVAACAAGDAPGVGGPRVRRARKAQALVPPTRLLRPSAQRECLVRPRQQPPQAVGPRRLAAASRADGGDLAADAREHEGARRCRARRVARRRSPYPSAFLSRPTIIHGRLCSMICMGLCRRSSRFVISTDWNYTHAHTHT